jgi:Flp pilus assembly protein TadD
MRGHIFRALAVTATLLALTGCKSFLEEGGPDDEVGGSITESSSFGAGPEQVWLQKGKDNYRNGDYGLAERFYRQAIEERHNNAEAWLGLAASYDRLKRFDLADRAYEQLIKITGHTPTVLNNLAYHQMLKGDYSAARQSLQAASSQSPDNPYIRNNIELLDRWEEKGARKAG